MILLRYSLEIFNSRYIFCFVDFILYEMLRKRKLILLKKSNKVILSFRSENPAIRVHRVN